MNIEKQTSGFDVGISTGLALEALLDPVMPVYPDPDRIPPKRYDVTKFDDIYFNVVTLLRNLLSSIEETERNTLQGNSIISLLTKEMETIMHLFQNKCKVHFYVCDYSNLLKPRTGTFSKMIRPRKATTIFAVRLEKIMNRAITGILKEHSRILKYTEDIKPKHKTKSIIMTHYVYDLLSYTRFKDLVLLESHTGKMKSRKDWNSKYFPVPKYNMSILPFNKPFIMIFGDRHMFSPCNIILRRQLMDLANNCKWNPFTDLHTVSMDIKYRLNDALVYEFFKSI